MKGAVGFVSAAFYVMAFLLLIGTNRKPTNITVVKPVNTTSAGESWWLKLHEQKLFQSLVASRKKYKLPFRKRLHQVDQRMSQVDRLNGPRSEPHYPSQNENS